MSSPFRESFISVVLEWQPEAESWVAALGQYLEQHFNDYEIVIIHAVAGEILARKLDHLLEQVPCVRCLELNEGFTTKLAMAAGFENAIGDYVLFMQADVDPIHLVEDALILCKRGPGVVLGVTQLPQTLAYALVRPFCSFILQLADYRPPPNWSGLVCLSRQVVNSAGATGRLHQQFVSRVLKSSNSFEILEYQVQSSLGRKKGLLRAIPETLELLVFNSMAPLRWANLLGLLGSFMAFLFSLYSLGIRLFQEGVVEGWTTTILFMSFPFMFLFTILAFFGEYLLRLLNTIGEPSEYFVRLERHSSRMVNKNRLNVLSESMSDRD